MNKRKVKIIIITILYIILVIELMISLQMFKSYKEKKVEIDEIQKKMIEIEEKKPLGNIEKVRERNNFYTVVSCVNRYLIYLHKKDKKILYNYLDNSYIEKNNITKENILQKLETLDKYQSFKAKEMYQQKISDKVTQYFAYGTIQSDDDVVLGREYHISIKIDNSSGTYTVLPNTYIK